jgi:hypothetical protein
VVITRHCQKWVRVLPDNKEGVFAVTDVWRWKCSLFDVGGAMEKCKLQMEFGLWHGLVGWVCGMVWCGCLVCGMVWCGSPLFSSSAMVSMGLCLLRNKYMVRMMKYVPKYVPK